MDFKISIVVPVYQNENNIESTIIELLSLAKKSPMPISNSFWSMMALRIVL